MMLAWELVLRQTLKCFPIAIQSRVQVLILSLELHIVNLRCVLLLLALFELALSLFDLLPNVGQEKILVQTMDISKLNIILLLLRGFGLP
jgi:hypothetical protein